MGDGNETKLWGNCWMCEEWGIPEQLGMLLLHHRDPASLEILFPSQGGFRSRKRREKDVELSNVALKSWKFPRFPFQDAGWGKQEHTPGFKAWDAFLAGIFYSKVPIFRKIGRSWRFRIHLEEKELVTASFWEFCGLKEIKLPSETFPGSVWCF